MGEDRRGGPKADGIGSAARRRKPKRDRGSLPLDRIYVQAAAALFCETARHRKAKARTFSRCFCGEKRLRRLCEDFGRHACSGVRDAKADVGARLQVGRMTELTLLFAGY